MSMDETGGGRGAKSRDQDNQPCISEGSSHQYHLLTDAMRKYAQRKYHLLPTKLISIHLWWLFYVPHTIVVEADLIFKGKRLCH